MSDEAKWVMRNVELDLGPAPRKDLGPIVDAVVASYRGTEIDSEDESHSHLAETSERR